jgi:hypothetical protein
MQRTPLWHYARYEFWLCESTQQTNVRNTTHKYFVFEWKAFQRKNVGPCSTSDYHERFTTTASSSTFQLTVRTSNAFWSMLKQNKE